MMIDNHTRRSFLGGLGAAPIAATSLLAGSRSALCAAGAQSQAMAGGAVAKGTRGRTRKADSEIREYRDAETGARVRQLTGDGSDNVHLYFTAESFISGSDRLVFGSNRSGRFQFYLLEIRDRRLVQLTGGNRLEPQQACVTCGGQPVLF
jgi:hypothetical protein